VTVKLEIIGRAPDLRYAQTEYVRARAAALIQIKVGCFVLVHVAAPYAFRIGGMTGFSVADGSARNSRLSMRARFSATHARILNLCDELEECADALPNRLDAIRCEDIAKGLMPLLTECHTFEEQCFEHIRKARLAALSESIRRLRLEHSRDRYFAEDIADALGQIRDNEPMKNPEALGFMLHSFFETQRRHIAFEREYILPALPTKRWRHISLL
jgi:hemerythrin-like domain-containing protein